MGLYRGLVTKLLEALSLAEGAEQALMTVLEQNRSYLDGKFFDILAGFAEEAAYDHKAQLAERLKQVLGIARSYRASLTLQKLPQGSQILEYDPVIEALFKAEGTDALNNALEQYNALVSEELVAVLLFRAMQARQQGRDELIQPLVQLADLVLMQVR